MPKITRILAGLASAALVGGLATTATAATPITTQAVEQCHGYKLNPGPLLAKKGFRSEYIGTIKLDGRCGVCIDYALQGPNGNWGTGPLSFINKDDREAVQYLTNANWADAAKSNRTAAALKIAINVTVSASFRSDYEKSYKGQLKKIDAGVAPKAAEMLAEAKRYAGPTSVKIAITSQPKPGTTGTATATALGNGHVYPGQPVRFAVTNATVASAGAKTNADGKASVRFVPNGAGKVRVTATLASPDWRQVVFSKPNGDRQHLVRGGAPAVGAKGLVEFDSTFSTTVTQDCGVECAGRPPVTFTAQAGLTPVQWRATSGTKTVAALSLKPKASGSKTFTGVDGQKIVFAYRVLVGKKWSGWRTASSFDVVCPAWPGITPVKVCACMGARSGGYTFTSPGGTRFYTVRLTIGGQAQEKPVAGNESVTLTGPIADGAHVTADFDAFADAAHTKRLSGGKLDGFIQD